MHIFVIFDIFVQIQETNNNLYLVEVTNNGRTTEGEYRVALPDGRVHRHDPQGPVGCPTLQYCQELS